MAQLPDDDRLEYEKILASILDGTSGIERVASDFLTSISSSRGKATAAMQKLYLDRVVNLAEELSSLLQDVSVRGTPADLFAMARRRMDPNEVFRTEMELMTGLSIISMLGKVRLRRGTLRDEQEVHNLTGKNTFERFKFATNAVQFYEQSTGKTAKAWINETVDGVKCSEAINFLMAVMNPVLLSVGYPAISPETARKEVQEIKKILNAGLYPNSATFGDGYVGG